VQAFVDGLGVVLERLGHGRVEQVRLVREVVVEGAEAHVRAFRDGMGAGAGATGLGEDLPRGADECLAVSARRRSNRFLRGAGIGMLHE
jgi:hypothetical protein